MATILQDIKDITVYFENMVILLRNMTLFFINIIMRATITNQKYVICTYIY